MNGIISLDTLRSALAKKEVLQKIFEYRSMSECGSVLCMPYTSK